MNLMMLQMSVDETCTHVTNLSNVWFACFGEGVALEVNTAILSS